MIHWTIMVFTLVLLLGLLFVAGLDGGVLAPLVVVGAALALLGAFVIFRPRRGEPG